MKALFTRALLALFALPLCGFAQGTQVDYDRAAGIEKLYRDALRPFRPQLRWLSDGGGVGWAKEDGSGYVLVKAESGELLETETPPAGWERADLYVLEPLARWRASRGGGEAVQVHFENHFDREVRSFWVETSGRLRSYGTIAPGATFTQSTYEGHCWVFDFEADDLAGIFIAGDWDALAHLDEGSRTLAMSPDRAAAEPSGPTLAIEDHQVVWRPAKGDAVRLTTDGTPADRYVDDFHLSPDGQWALGFQRLEQEIRKIQVLDEDLLDGPQLRQNTRTYPKPGDPLRRRRPRLFDLAKGHAVPVDDSAFDGSYGIEHVHWAPDGSRVSLVVTDRGHQRQRLLSLDAATGAITTLVEETSETFVDTTQKTMLHWLDQREQFVWASERSGYNHLYLFDARTGELVRPLTQGEWVVRGIERVDEEAGTLWLKGYGVYPEQDPTYAHLGRVDLETGEITWLTEANGTHTWRFSPDGTYLVARWSRVDQPTVTELRRVEDGALVRELGRDDDSELRARGFLPPERFAAPGRDGETKIHGILFRPSNFDPAKKYPVIENIYAGPHDHHVPQSFGLSIAQRRLAELGFIVVQIDGMGTNWRSKAFHDLCWQNLADGGLPDRIAWMRAAAETRPEMDLDRVGIYGGSAGGQNALAALLFHGDFYDAGAADCGCHDNRIDKLWWNEAWMGKLGPHYAENSNVTHAAKLHGDLFLTVGLSDTNVDPACTLAVVDALIAADRDFEFVAVPGGEHGVGESPYLFRRRQDFFVRSLYGREPRSDVSSQR